MTDFKKCREELAKKLVCSFGYSEVEEEVLERCIEAIKTKNMVHLKQPLVVYCAGAEKLVKMAPEKVKIVLQNRGIWQYVESEIAETN